jgi:hypothetical protein
MKQDHIAAHKHSSNHRKEIMKSDICGCFYCLSIFKPAEILDWIGVKENEADINEKGQTALCPKCGIDSIIGSKSGYPIAKDFLEKMHTHWF